MLSCKVLCCVVFFSQALAPLLVFAAAPSRASTTARSNNNLISSRKTSNKRIINDRKNSTIVLQIIETEVFVNGTWRYPDDGSAWSHPSTGETMVHPLQYQLDDENKQWQGEWKIAITGRSSHGWAYFYDTESSSPLLQYTVRKRTWLRTIVVSAPPLKRQRRLWIPSAIAEDWNFKGYGWTLYKSAVFPKSCGIGFRIPLTSNSASWETYKIPASLSMSVSAFNSGDWPAIHLNASVRMEWLQWFFEHTFHNLIPAVIQATALILLHGLLVAINALLYPIFRRSIWNDASQQWLWNSYRPKFRGRSIQYASDREERIGVSWSFRFRDRVRFSVWHFNAWQLPSIVSWITRRSAALGWSISGPVKGEPDLLCSATVCFLLSGYYFRRSPATLSSSDRREDSAPKTPKVSVLGTQMSTSTTKELKATRKQVAEALLQ